MNEVDRNTQMGDFYRGGGKEQYVEVGIPVEKWFCGVGTGFCMGAMYLLFGLSAVIPQNGFASEWRFKMWVFFRE